MKNLKGLSIETNYLTFEVMDNDYLKITATENGKERIKELLQKDDYDYNDIWNELTEEGKCNSGFRMFDCGVVGAMTDAPIIGYDWCMFDEDEEKLMSEEQHRMNPEGIKDIKYVWWFPNYMVSDEFEILLSESLIFTYAYYKE